MMSLPAFGSLCLHLALLVVAVAAPLFFRARDARGTGLASARLLLGAVAGLLSASVVTLSLAAITHDFRIEYVASYTDRTTAIPYLISAVWAGQSGSLLVWAAMLAWMALLVSGRLRDKAPTLEPATAGFLCLLIGFFLFVLVGWSNPFGVLDGPPRLDGAGLNPLLRNVLMIFHPPALLAGYAAYGPPAAITAAALLTGKLDRTFLRELRTWALIAWALLTVGNMLGMLWAYEELGWGGYWGWDPVENASLIPWLTGTAVLHLLIAERRGRVLAGSSAALTLVTFWLTLFGTYLTRSGIVASVHAFSRTVVADAFAVLLVVVALATIAAIALRRRAFSPPTWVGAVLVGRSAVGVSALTLGLELEFTGGFLVAPLALAAITAWHAVRPSLRGSFGDWLSSYVVAGAVAGIVEPTIWLPTMGCVLVLVVVGFAFGALDGEALKVLLLRTRLLTATAWLLTGIALGVLFGTLLPVLSRLFVGESYQVDATWYNGWAAPAGLLLLALTGTCLSFGWRGPGRRSLQQRLLPALVAGDLVAAVAWMLGVSSPLALAALDLSGLVAAAAVIRALGLFGVGRPSKKAATQDGGESGATKASSVVPTAPRLLASLGAVVAHLGLAILFLGLSGDAGKQEDTFLLRRGHDALFASYTISLESIEHRFELEREVLEAAVLVRDQAHRALAVLRPARHLYRTHSNQPTSEAGVLSTIGGDLFVTLGEADLDEQQVWVRAVETPLLVWVWIGCVLIALGGVLAVTLSLRPPWRAVAIGGAAIVVVAAVGWLWRPSAATILAAGLFIVLSLWWLGLVLIKPILAPAPPRPRCPKCDAPLIRDSQFCHRCGAEIGEEADDEADDETDDETGDETGDEAGDE